ncbi:MAG TPA: VTT domain-containing protein [Vicinamibacterales bacterium]|nr:VTT domain-containing protein [Vicinamibacterales bacterium]
MLSLLDQQALALAASLALATLVSEDLACIAAGMLVAGGQLGFASAVGGCFCGIAAGDLLLFVAGRTLGRRVLDWRMVRRRVSATMLERSAVWLQRRGPLVVFASRFLPGTRVPTCLAAGMLQTSALTFTLWFLLAAAAWTPLLVGASVLVGMEAAASTLATGREAVLRALLASALLILAVRGYCRLRTWEGRRRLYGAWKRATRWEFWPAWVVYLPVVLYVVYLGIRHRCLTVFTAANPGIPDGGVIGESKFDILQKLSPAGVHVARAARVPAGIPTERRSWLVRQFLEHQHLSLPVVLKPDQGQRGAGVVIARTAAEVDRYVAASRTAFIVQEYVPGREFGVFYCRRPSEHSGRIISLTEKRFPHLVGDGVRSIEELILADERAVCQERTHRAVHRERLTRVPGMGERVPLVEIGSHCRGSLFLDAGRLITPAMEDAFDRTARQFEGFHFGRFDVRTPSIDEFREGRSFTILELNGVTSEATHIYDPSLGPLNAWRVLFRQWRLACEIGASNVRRGTAPAPLIGLLRRVVSYRRQPAVVTSLAPPTSNQLEVNA